MSLKSVCPLPVSIMSFKLTNFQRGPDHYDCSPLGAGVDQQVLPNIGWVNVMPAADANVDVTLLGHKLNFVGNGYHDKVYCTYS